MAREPTTILDAFAERLASDPDGPYLEFAGHESVQLTAREMDRAVESPRATRSVRWALIDGDRVATLLENRAEQVISFFAAIKIGAIQVPINTAYKGEFLRHQLADSGAKVFVVQGDYASRADRGRGRRRDARPCACHHRRPAGRRDRRADGHDVARRRRGGERRADHGCRGCGPPTSPRSFYTGGTTGASKGCALSHGYHLSIPPDHLLVGADAGRRGVEPAAAVPFQRHLLPAHRDAAHRRPGRPRAPVLGLRVLARDPPDGCHDRPRSSARWPSWSPRGPGAQAARGC